MEMGQEIALLSMPRWGGDVVLPFDTWAEVKARARHGQSIRRIAKELGLHRETVRRVLRQVQPEPYRRPLRPSILAPYEGFVQRRAPEIGFNAWRLFQEVRG
jgi:transposase